MMYTVQRTDCFTGWMVVRPNGRPRITVRTREAAQRIADEWNGKDGK